MRCRLVYAGSGRRPSIAAAPSRDTSPAKPCGFPPAAHGQADRAACSNHFDSGYSSPNSAAGRAGCSRAVTPGIFRLLLERPVQRCVEVLAGVFSRRDIDFNVNKWSSLYPKSTCCIRHSCISTSPVHTSSISDRATSVTKRRAQPVIAALSPNAAPGLSARVGSPRRHLSRRHNTEQRLLIIASANAARKTASVDVDVGPTFEGLAEVKCHATGQTHASIRPPGRTLNPKRSSPAESRTMRTRPGA